MRRAVLVICDGHRSDMVRAELCPNIAGLAAISRVFARHAGIFPSATRASSASIATGCLARTHGLHGNRIALDTGEGLVVRDAGRPDFREHLRRATGRTLRVPTLAQRLAGHGGAVVCANGSPGAAYLQDPDGFGYVYHRWRSTAPGGDAMVQPDHIEAPKGAVGDRAMTGHFRDIALGRRRPALGVLWLSEPDATAHEAPLGSPEHVDAIGAVDQCVGQVAERVEALRAAGDEVLLLVGSDHGHESTVGIVCLADELAAAGLKESPESNDVLVATQGSAGLVYLADGAAAKEARIVGFLKAHRAIGEVHAGDGLLALGQRPEGGLRIAFSMAKSDEPNEHGVRGTTHLVVAPGDVEEKVGFGHHGGLGAHERHPFLMVSGGGFAPASESEQPSSIIDIAPTILRFLGLPFDGMDGRPLPRDDR